MVAEKESLSTTSAYWCSVTFGEAHYHIIIAH